MNQKVFRRYIVHRYGSNQIKLILDMFNINTVAYTFMNLMPYNLQRMSYCIRVFCYVFDRYVILESMSEAGEMLA